MQSDQLPFSDESFEPVDVLEEISKFIFASKYARYDYDLKRRETWSEAIDRVQNMHLKKFRGDKLTSSQRAKIRWAFDTVRDKMDLPSMRSLQFGGKAVEVHNARQFNCSVRHVDSIRSFAEIFYLLLCGCGVGIGITKKHVSRIPPLVDAMDRTGTVITYVIEDSIEGWADSVEVLLLCYTKGNAFSGRKVVFDYSRIRPQGSPLKTGGGRAPGYLPLKIAHGQIKTLIENRIESQHLTHLRPVDVYDILMYTADAVISGGVRRSATIVVFDKDDEEMLTAKTGNWFEENPQRGRSNNSVLLLRNDISFEEFKQIIERTKQWGEPGFIFADHEDTLFNPCAEIGFIPVTQDGRTGVQFCVSGDTKLITKSGLVSIQSAINRDTEIWNGEQWVTVKPFQTGETDKLYRVTFSDGSYLDATDNHKFLVKTSYWPDYKEMSTLEIKCWLSTHSSGLHIPKPNVSGGSPNGEVINYAYEYGFFKGDGHLDHGVPKFNLYADDKKCGIQGYEYPKTYFNFYGTPYTIVRGDGLDPIFCKELKEGLPSFLASWSENSFLQFMAGWIDADGSKANNGCRLYGDEQSLRTAQLLLTKFGIQSSINIMSLTGTATNLGIRKSDVWYLQIPNASKIPSRRLDLTSGKDAKFKGKWQYIRSVIELDGVYASYCLEEPNKHQCLFNNVLTKQCNLTSINYSKIHTEEELMDAVEAATIIGTLQATYTDFPYLSSAAKELTEEEALLGVSMTAMMENPTMAFDSTLQRRAAEKVVETNVKWAKILKINPAARTTCIKPEGTGSLAVGTMASGVHAAHDHWMFRRVQVNKFDPVYQYFKDHNPHMCEESVWSTNKTDDVITFPVRVPDSAMVKSDIDAISHLSMIKATQENWVLTGTVSTKRPVTHNVSCTVQVKDVEWEQVTNYLYINRNFFGAVSLIPDDGDKKYAQAPVESVVTSEDFEKYSKLLYGMIPVDYTELFEEEDLTSRQEEIACAGGACLT